jgi:hypothetical protein
LGYLGVDGQLILRWLLDKILDVDLIILAHVMDNLLFSMNTALDL